MTAAKPNGGAANREILALLEDSDFSFHMRGWKGDVAEFFAPTPEHRAVIEERARWLRDTPDLYGGTLEGAGAPVGELATLTENWTGTATGGSDPAARCLALGGMLEPDFILLTEARDAGYRTVAGVICFPSSWDFRHALGKRVSEIHGIVPGLNDAVGDRIDALLRKLRAGDSWSRLNWGISLSPERNQHPSRDLPRLSTASRVDAAWLRVELQVLHKLPTTGAILFGIRPVSISFDEVAATPAAAAALKRQLNTMPAAMLDYKGIGENAPLLDRWLS